MSSNDLHTSSKCFGLICRYLSNFTQNTSAPVLYREITQYKTPPLNATAALTQQQPSVLSSVSQAVYHVDARETVTAERERERANDTTKKLITLFLKDEDTLQRRHSSPSEDSLAHTHTHTHRAAASSLRVMRSDWTQQFVFTCKCDLVSLSNATTCT